MESLRLDCNNTELNESKQPEGELFTLCVTDHRYIADVTVHEVPEEGRLISLSLCRCSLEEQDVGMLSTGWSRDMIIDHMVTLCTSLMHRRLTVRWQDVQQDVCACV